MLRWALPRLPWEPSFMPWSKTPQGPMFMAPRGAQQAELDRHSCGGGGGGLLLPSGHRSPSSSRPCPARNFSDSALGQGLCCDSREAENKPQPFQLLGRPGRGTRGPAEWSDLEKVGRASEVEQQCWGRGSHAAIKERLPIKDPFSLSSGADMAPTSFCIHKASLGSAFKYC